MSLGHWLKNACVGSVTYKNMQTLSVQHKPIVLPYVCVCVYVWVCLRRRARALRISKVFKAAMWSHAKFIMFFCFVFGVTVQYPQYGAKRQPEHSSVLWREYRHGNRVESEWKTSLNPKTTVLPEWYFLHFPSFNIFSIFAPLASTLVLLSCLKKTNKMELTQNVLPTTVVQADSMFVLIISRLSLSFSICVPLCMYYMYVGDCAWTNFVTVVQSLVKLTCVYKYYT